MNYLVLSKKKKNSEYGQHGDGAKKQHFAAYGIKSSNKTKTSQLTRALSCLVIPQHTHPHCYIRQH